jgi:hemerythrin superfamily protein
MNANDLLKAQHRDVEQKYTQFKTATGAEREHLGKEILTDLTAHAEIEEEFYYPALADAGDTAAVDEYKAEHAEMKTLITKLTMMGAEDDAYVPTMKALMESVIHHAKEEEAEGMPEAAKRLGNAKLEALGPKMKERFQELKQSTLKRLWASIT